MATKTQEIEYIPAREDRTAHATWRMRLSSSSPLGDVTGVGTKGDEG